MDINEKAKKELIIRASKRGITKLRSFMILKNEISTEFKIDSLPNYGLTQVYEKLVKAKKIKKNEDIERLLKKAKMRTLSGVAVVAVLTKAHPCPGNCLYCPSQADMPKSYLSNEPAVMRAILADFNPYRQIEIRLKALEQAGHSTDKIELIIMGGSFNALPLGYQYWFVKECFVACNEFKEAKSAKRKVQNDSLKLESYIREPEQFNLEILKKDLLNEQKKNEKAKHRIIGLTLETRPDLISKDELVKFRELGCTRIEIGVQSIYDDILKKNRRGHDVAETARATKLMKDFGFKVSYHMMPGLYGSNLKKDLEMFEVLFNDTRFQPDQIKIYPCVVVKDSDLYKLWKEKKYKPYTDKQLLDLICEIKKIIPPYVRISRLIRDIPEESIVAGNKITNLRQLIDNRSQKEGWKCKCIRCREIRDEKSQKSLRFGGQAKGKSQNFGMATPYINIIGSFSNLKINKIEYRASAGDEIFLELIDNDSYYAKAPKDRSQLYSLLRLRLPVGARHALPNNRNSRGCSLQINDPAIIREVHTYGQAVEVGEIGDDAKQHKGLGKKLILEAEDIAKKAGYKKISVISGVGARDYYKKLGYKLDGTYMMKKLK